MNKKVKDIDIKNWIYYFFNDIINIKNFDAKHVKIDEKSYKNTPIYYIGYVTIKLSKYVKTNSVNPLYLIFNKVNGYFGGIYILFISLMQLVNGANFLSAACILLFSPPATNAVTVKVQLTSVYAWL